MDFGEVLWECLSVADVECSALGLGWIREYGTIPIYMDFCTVVR